MYLLSITDTEGTTEEFVLNQPPTVTTSGDFIIIANTNGDFIYGVATIRVLKMSCREIDTEP